MTLRLFIFAAVLVWTRVQGQTPAWIDNRFLFPLNESNADQNGTADPGSEIVNGQVTRHGEHPYICSLQEQIRGSWFFLCGSVIFNQNTILTAAHCVQGPESRTFRVRCGEFDLLRTDQSQVTRAIVNVNVHPQWQDNSRNGFPNDIATLQVASPLSFNRFVNTLPIPTGRTAVSRTCKLVGWGRTESQQISYQLREVTITRLSNRQCTRSWRQLINRGHVCFLNRRTRASACNGDSGGPAVCGGFLVGVTSWGNSQCSGTFPSVYTRLSSFRTWIQRNSF